MTISIYQGLMALSLGVVLAVLVSNIPIKAARVLTVAVPLMGVSYIFIYSIISYL